MQNLHPVTKAAALSIALGLPGMLSAAAFSSADLELSNVGFHFYSSYAIGDDINGDGISDIVATTPFDVDILSGETGDVLHQTPLQSVRALEIVADKNSDGLRDLAVVNGNKLALLSGANGDLLRSMPTNAFADTILEVPDTTGDGVSELVLFQAGSPPMHLINGFDLSTISIYDAGSYTYDAVLVDDLSGDGIKDLAVLETDGASYAVSFHSATDLSPLRKIPISPAMEHAGDEFRPLQLSEVADQNGDEIADIAVAASVVRRDDEVLPTISIHSGSDGDLIRVYPLSVQGSTTAVAHKGFTIVDWNGAGAQVAVLGLNHYDSLEPDEPSTEVVFVSLESGSIVQSFYQPDESYMWVSDFEIGDLNRDGLSDLLISVSPAANSADGRLPTGLLFTAKSMANYAEEFFLTGTWFDRTINSFDEVMVEFSRNSESKVQLTLLWRMLRANEYIPPQWYVAGPVNIEGMGSLVFADLYQASGAEFGSRFLAEDVQIRPVGRISFNISSCNDAELIAEFDDGTSRALPLQSLRSAFGLPCQKIAEVSETDPTGIWWNPERAGEGLFVDSLSFGDGETLTRLRWLTHLQGEPYWVDGMIDNGVPVNPIDPDMFVDLLDFRQASCDHASLVYSTETESIPIAPEEGTIGVERGFAGTVIGSCSEQPID